MIVFPNAKINIGLNIVAKRADGYHDLETVFYPVKIHDALEAITAPQTDFTTSGTIIPGDGKDNLCVKAFEAISRDYDILPLKIHLHKHIPIGAGLGGGSADAAFFIKLINIKFELGLSIDAMEGYAKQLGADCAFFIQNKPVLAYQKGDCFKPVELDLSRYVIVIVMPQVHVATADAYAGVLPTQPVNKLNEVIKQPVTAWRHLLKNDFEESVFKKFAVVGRLKNELYECGALYASMSGSGAAVYGIFHTCPDLKHLEKSATVFYNV